MSGAPVAHARLELRDVVQSLLLMRRSFASLVLFLQLAGFALPFVQAQQAVPACCRRGGQHHCATPLPVDGFRSAPANCPYRHFTGITSHLGDRARGSEPGRYSSFVLAGFSSQCFSRHSSICRGQRAKARTSARMIFPFDNAHISEALALPGLRSAWSLAA